MRSRHIYAHWMDPDYLSVRALGGQPLDERRRQFEGIVKMHALLGDSICLSDVQLIESGLLLYMFCNIDFRSFISEHPDFLRLVTNPTDHLGATSDRLARVGSGLDRIKALGDNYFSSTFNSADTMRRVVRLFQGIRDEVEAEGVFGPNGELTRFVKSYNLTDKPLVIGLFHSLEHFVLNKDAPVIPPSGRKPPGSYYEELDRTYAVLESHGTNLAAALSAILRLAGTEKERFQRTLMIPKLPNATEVGHPDRTKYLLIIQAWNVAVSRTIGADTNSAYSFRQTFPIPVYAGETTHCTSILPHAAAADDELFRQVPHFNWHPSQLNWKTLARIRRDCWREITEFQDAIRGLVSNISPEGEIVEEKLKALSEAAGKVVSEEESLLPVPPTWLVNACATLGYGITLGSAVWGNPVVAAVTGAPTGLFHTYTALAVALKSRRAAEIGEAILSYGFQYNIHRTEP